MSNPLAAIAATADCGSFSLNTVEIADFLAGFVAGFTGDDWQTYFEGCFQDTDAFEQTICTAVNDFATKDNRMVIEGVHLILGQMSNIEGFLSACPNASADLKTVADWGHYWMNQGSLHVYSTAYKNLTGNISTLMADVHLLEDDYDNHNYYGTAQEAAAIAKLALPLPTAEQLEGMVGDHDCGDFSLNTTIIADYLAGFMNGFTGHDDKAAMEACFMDNDSFETDVCEFVADFRTKDNRKVMEGIQKVLGDLPEINSFMDSCPASVQADKAVVSDWFKYWKGQGELKVYQTAYKNVVGNFPQIKEIANGMADLYDAHDYFGVADSASTIAKIALPVATLGDDEDTCNALGDGDCQANSICSWCTAGAVPSACHSLENAKHLPAAVFICSGLGSEFLQ